MKLREVRAVEINTNQARRLLAGPNRDTPSGARNAAVIALLYLGGLRVAELVAARIGDFDAAAEVLLVAGRRVPVVAGLREALGRWIGHHPRAHDPDAPLVATLEGGPISDSYVRGMLLREAAAAHLRATVNATNLRDLCGYELAAAGANRDQIAALLGFADARSAGKFLVAGEDALAAIMRRRDDQPRLPTRPDGGPIIPRLVKELRAADPDARAELVVALTGGERR